MTIIGAIAVISTIMNISVACSIDMLQVTENSVEHKLYYYGIVALILTSPACLSSYFFVKWFINDDGINRENLPKACVLQIQTQLMLTVWALIYISVLVWNKTSFKINFLIGRFLSLAIFALFFWYSKGVCKKYWFQ